MKETKRKRKRKTKNKKNERNIKEKKHKKKEAKKEKEKKRKLGRPIRSRGARAGPFKRQHRQIGFAFSTPSPRSPEHRQPRRHILLSRRLSIYLTPLSSSRAPSGAQKHLYLHLLLPFLRRLCILSTRPGAPQLGRRRRSSGSAGCRAAPPPTAASTSLLERPGRRTDERCLQHLLGLLPVLLRSTRRRKPWRTMITMKLTCSPSLPLSLSHACFV